MEAPKTNPDHVIFNPNFSYQTGLTKREYFAALAMQGLLSNSAMMNYSELITRTKSQLAQMAISSADALINELNKE
jgi:hypothetical protein